jgi:ceramide glucosyltransferase
MMASARLALSCGAGLLTLCGVASLLLGYRAAMRYWATRRPGELPDAAPAVTIFKAVEGADEATCEAFESYLHLDYPGRVEYLIGTLREEDPVAAVTRRLQAAHPDRDLRLVFGELVGANRKTSIMRSMVAQATTDLFIFTDGDVRAEPDLLRWLVPATLDPAVGCVTALPEGLPCRCLGGQMAALHYEFVYLPQWMMAQQTTGIEWAIGHTMCQRREVYEAYGGFDGFLDALADDYEFANRAVKLGYKAIVLPYLVQTYMPQEGFVASVKRIRRWLRTIRGVRPKPFIGLVFTYPLAWSLVLALLNPCAAWAWGVFAAVTLLRLATAWRLDAVALDTGTMRRSGWLLPVVDVVNLYAYVMAFLNNTVLWAGRRYRMMPGGAMIPLDE